MRNNLMILPGVLAIFAVLYLIFTIPQVMIFEPNRLVIHEVDGEYKDHVLDKDASNYAIEHVMDSWPDCRKVTSIVIIHSKTIGTILQVIYNDRDCKVEGSK